MFNQLLSNPSTVLLVTPVVSLALSWYVDVFLSFVGVRVRTGQTKEAEEGVWHKDGGDRTAAEREAGKNGCLVSFEFYQFPEISVKKPRSCVA